MNVSLNPNTSLVQIPFSALDNGTPIAALDPKNLVTMQWELSAGDVSAGCSADVTVANVSFY